MRSSTSTSMVTLNHVQAPFSSIPGHFDEEGKKLMRPSFEDLPVQPDHPRASAWGLYGDDDELGTLNLLSPGLVRDAAMEIQLGEVVTLNLPLDYPRLPMNPRRQPCDHQIIPKGYANDDTIHMNTQGSSHWDGLRHYPYQDDHKLRYYNNATQEDISGLHKNLKIGVHNIAQRGIVGRGVLLDYGSWAEEHGIQYSAFTGHAIQLPQLLDIAVGQGVKFRPGDILLIRTGWTKEYDRMTEYEQIAIAQREERTFVGVEASREMIKWHWDMQFAAVASDTNAYEKWPPTKPWGVSCHEVFLSGWGMPIGELWDLEALSQKCRQLNRWTFFLTSCPLNLKGGVASPANAIATF